MMTEPRNDALPIQPNELQTTLLNRTRTWFYIGLCNFLAAGIIGALLRAIYVVDLPFLRFKNWLHGHSHTALLGWLFIGVVIALLHDGKSKPLSRTVKGLLIGIQICVLGMLIAFPLQGYGAVSITASTLHMFLSYFLVAIIWRRSAAWPEQGSKPLVRWSIAFFVLSTLGALSFAPLTAYRLQGHEIYYWSLQFFLHFQFNGWFWFAAMALAVRWAERQGMSIHIDRTTLTLWVLSAILTYALAIAWSEPLPAVFATVAVGVALQLWAAWRTFRILKGIRLKDHTPFPGLVKWLVGISLVSMTLKVVVQGAVAIPDIATMALTIRHFVMGFIHMNTLATMTMLLLAYAILSSWTDTSHRLTRWGIGTVIAGVVLSELILFSQGVFLWLGWGMISGHYWQLFIASSLIPLGTLLIIMQGLFAKPASQNLPLQRV